MKSKHNIDFAKASFKNFEMTPDFDIMQRSEVFADFTQYMIDNGQMNFRFITNGCGPVTNVVSPYSAEKKTCVSLVSNDYLNFT